MITQENIKQINEIINDADILNDLLEELNAFVEDKFMIFTSTQNTFTYQNDKNEFVKLIVNKDEVSFIMLHKYQNKNEIEGQKSLQLETRKYKNNGYIELETEIKELDIYLNIYEENQYLLNLNTLIKKETEILTGDYENSKEEQTYYWSTDDLSSIKDFDAYFRNINSENYEELLDFYPDGYTYSQCVYNKNLNIKNKINIEAHKIDNQTNFFENPDTNGMQINIEQLGNSITDEEKNITLDFINNLLTNNSEEKDKQKKMRKTTKNMP